MYMNLRLKELCQLRRVSQKELAAQLEVTEMTLSRASKGNTSMQLLERIAKALNVEIWELFTESTGESEIFGFVKVRGTIYEIKSRGDVENLLKYLD